MFAYLEGNLTYKSPSLLHLSVGGVGYEVHISLRTYEKVQALDHCRLYTHLRIAEDAWTMYGFADEVERATFRSLIEVQGVGAATARLLLSSMSPEELHAAVATDNAIALGRVKGIGPKTAQRLVLELKGKLAIPVAVGGTAVQTSWRNTTADDALIALVNLGIARPAAEAAVKRVSDAANLPVEEVIKLALRAL